jgi:hypothetical protein
MGIEINYCSVTEVVNFTFRGCSENRAGEVGACHTAFEFTPRSPLAKAPVLALHHHQLRGVELPFLILCVNSIPLIATTALSNRFNPSIG